MAWMGWLRSLAGWVLGVLGVLASAALVAALAYWGLLALGLPPRDAAAVAFPLGPAFVVALFTVALWRSTHAQAEASREMRELQKRVVHAELSPLLGARVVWEPREVGDGVDWWLEVSNLSKYGVLLTGVYWLESCSSDSLELSSIERLGARSAYPVALTSGETKNIVRVNPPVDPYRERGKRDVELGCLVLSILYGSEPHVRCYRAKRVVNVEVKFKFEYLRGAFRGYEENPSGGTERRVAVYGVLLEECACPHVLEESRLYLASV